MQSITHPLNAILVVFQCLLKNLEPKVVPGNVGKISIQLNFQARNYEIHIPGKEQSLATDTLFTQLAVFYI